MRHVWGLLMNLPLLFSGENTEFRGLFKAFLGKRCVYFSLAIELLISINECIQNRLKQ